jgi:hypothetical protein
MKCEEFEAIGLDAGRDGTLSELERAAAREHAGTCPRCAALQESWQTARVELQAFGEATSAASTPARVEMRLRQEFRTQHHTVKVRRAAVIAAWALATAAVLIGAVSWNTWRSGQHPAVGNPGAQTNPGSFTATGGDGGAKQQAPNQNLGANSETLVADSELGDFTLLPGVLPSDTDDAAVLRVRMQRGALGALGLPVSEENASDWIQVDLLVGDDGLPEAVRLPQEN